MIDPNQAFMIEDYRRFIKRMKPEKIGKSTVWQVTGSYEDGETVRKKRKYWTDADFAFTICSHTGQGPTGKWTDERDDKVKRSLVRAGVLIQERQAIGVKPILREDKIQQFKIGIPTIVLGLYQSDLEILRTLLSSSGSYDKSIEIRADAEDLAELEEIGLISHFGGSRWYLSDVQKMRAEMILSGKAEGWAFRIIHPKRTYKKHKTEEERKNARRRQVRDAVRRLRRKGM